MSSGTEDFASNFRLQWLQPIASSSSVDFPKISGESQLDRSLRRAAGSLCSRQAFCEAEDRGTLMRRQLP
jgi:hypothetical protein